MADFTYTYREEQIPGASEAGVITTHTPGKLIARAITELQELAVTDVDLDLSGGITDEGTSIEDNTLNLRLSVDVPSQVEGHTGNINAVSGGEWPLLTIQRLEVENGLIKSVESDEGTAYPEKELYDGEAIISLELSFGNKELTISCETASVQQGVVVAETQNVEKTVTIDTGDDYPEGGEQGMVLTRTKNSQDELGVAWDYVRAISVGG
jgi:hypothetical protein